MSKLGQTNYTRSERDFYKTPIIPIQSLTPHLPQNLTFCEPCAGAYDLANNLIQLRPDIKCNAAFDIFPQTDKIILKSATDITEKDVAGIDMFITNPPFKWDMFDPILSHLLTLRPTWLLIPADFMHNKRMVPYMEKCSKIVSVGRVKWFDDSKATSTDNFCWYKFEKDIVSYTEFFHRLV